ncbi:MAG TPA: ChbG/HpnK family deacetylase [Candidatus Limnocylindrales bacterium]|nr:ChbG/HpnK family deacetylase [Candidatus Limnocylindrales bacterium]
MKELILNADDFGLTCGVNEAIVRAHREGSLTSATLMANAAAFDNAVSRALANPSLGVGCHLVLVGGHSVAQPEEVPSLVDSEGNLPASLGAFVARLSSGLIREREIEREMRAQIEKIRAAGIEPTHLDTHKHTHAHPMTMAALARVAAETGIKRVRKPFETLRDAWATSKIEGVGASTQLMAVAAARVAAPRFDTVAREYGLRSPDHFLGVAMTGQMSAPVLRQMVATLADGSTEIMMHPGILDSDLIATGSRLQSQRQTEFEALLDPELKRILAKQEIRLISYRELN